MPKFNEDIKKMAKENTDFRREILTNEPFSRWRISLIVLGLLSSASIHEWPYSKEIEAYCCCSATSASALFRWTVPGASSGGL
jgi:hypothetical protein